MGSSPGFGSPRRDAHRPPKDRCGRPVRTRVRCAWGPPGPSAHHDEELAGSFFNRHASTPALPDAPLANQEGRTGANGLWLTVGRRFQDLFHSPRRGTFHRSLAVLVRYRSRGVCSLGAWSPQLPAGFLVSRGTHVPSPGRPAGTGYGALTPCGAPFQALRLPHRLAHFLRVRQDPP
jgi:hypothetical protein